MSILATNTKLVKVGQEYSAGSGISIDDYVISVTASLTGDYASQSAFDELSDSFSSLSSNINSNSGTWNDTSDVVKESSASWNQGKTYEGISPIVVNNDENVVSAETWVFSAGSNVSFVDDNVNKITRIDCTVTGEGGDPQVNSFVYENSAKINDVNSSYQSNSGTFLTAAPANMATTGDVAELAQTISETYQVKGDYLTTADSANFYPANNPSAFITGVDLSNYYQKNETSGASEIADALANIPTGNPEVENYVQTNSGTIDDTVTSYQTNSGTYLTAHQAISAEEWNSNYETVNTNSGVWGGGASYTAGDNINITNNVISVDDVSNLSAGDGISITQDSSYTTISWLNDAGIKNVVYTASLPATPDNNTLYLIPET